MIIESILLFLTTIVAYCYYKLRKVHIYFDKNGIKYVPGVIFFGNRYKSITMKAHPIEDFDTVYKKFPDEKYVGYITGHFKNILIRDPELVKAITVKNFDHFVNRRQILPEDEPLFGSSLLMMQGIKWRDMRTTLSPAFTGAKMRHMVPFIVETSDNVIKYIKDHISEVLDVDDLMHKYTNDDIATTAFGLQVNSFKNVDNEFYKTGQNILKKSLRMKLIVLMFPTFPDLVKKLGVRKFFDDEVVMFFKNVVSSTIEYRTANNVTRSDMIQLLIDASKDALKHDGTENGDVGFARTKEILKPQETSRSNSHIKHIEPSKPKQTRAFSEWKLSEMTAQAFFFFAAGFETVASTLTMCIHLLALNSEPQEKLYKEIRDFKEKYREVTYENIIELKYLDCVLNETMRCFSPAIVIDRVCLTEFQLPPSSDGAKPLTLKPGDAISIPINSFHWDPKNFPEPEKFNPERFSDENKENIKLFTFMPFGAGPRNCIGSRFALLELKVLLYNIVLNYKIVRCEQTSDPIKLKPTDFRINAREGSFVKFEVRE